MTKKEQRERKNASGEDCDFGLGEREEEGPESSWTLRQGMIPKAASNEESGGP